MSVQTSSSVVKAVCFAKEKKEYRDILYQHQSPVKMKKYGVSNKCEGQDIVIDRHTMLTPCTASFPYKSLKIVPLLHHCTASFPYKSLIIVPLLHHCTASFPYKSLTV